MLIFSLVTVLVQFLGSRPWILGYLFLGQALFHHLYNPWGFITTHPQYLSYSCILSGCTHRPPIHTTSSIASIHSGCTHMPPTPTTISICTIHRGTTIDVSSEQVVQPSAPPTSDSPSMPEIFTVR
jgi:hypothetical protein